MFTSVKKNFSRLGGGINHDQLHVCMHWWSTDEEEKTEWYFILEWQTVSTHTVLRYQLSRQNLGWEHKYFLGCVCWAGKAYFCNIFSNPEIPDSNSPLRVKVLSRHVNIICIFVFILIFTIMIFFLKEGERRKNKKKRATSSSCFLSNQTLIYLYFLKLLLLLLLLLAVKNWKI